MITLKRSMVTTEVFYSLQSKYYDDSSETAVGKIKDETAGAAIEEFVAVNPSMYSLLVDDISEHKKPKVVDKNVVPIISQGE